MKLLVLLLVNIVAVFAEDLPTLDYNAQWGPSDQSSSDTSIRPFEITFDDEMIMDLKSRLESYRQPRPTFEDVNFRYGFNSNSIGSWLKYWANEYDFKAREKELNKYPQYKVTVQGLDIHFIWVKPVNQTKRTVPLLLLHGWPGSVLEFRDVIPLLTADSDDRDFGVEVIVPSLPGFGYSDAASKPGMGGIEIAIILKNFMNILGHEKFCVQGGDWGSVIGTILATLFPEAIAGFHTNLPLALTKKTLALLVTDQALPKILVDDTLTERMYPLLDKGIDMLEETGFFHYQATKPDTLGIALSDTPAGFLAYFLQCFSSATRKTNKDLADGGLLNQYTRDQLLDNLMLYWAPNKITTSFRLYYETIHNPNAFTVLSHSTDVPLWALQAPDELAYMSENMLKSKFKNVLHNTVLDEGGHFLALERPAVFADDVLQAIDGFLNHTEKKHWWQLF